MKSINFLFTMLFLLLLSCQSFKDAGKVLRNEKTNTTDEFLVKKRNPLVIPPNFEKVPEPGSIREKKENNEEKIKKILKAPKKENTTSNKPSSLEDSILNRIRK
tara:strand:+ start:2756 stop:3067 length:312 start_codon:yes stop_codon:yes gene_type:complete